MIEALLVVLSRPLDGRHEEFNDWYSNIHVRDAMRYRGSIATRRFARAERRPAGYNNPLGWAYLALYEVSDARLFVREHVEASGTVRMEITDSFDVSVINDYHYYPLAFRDADPALADDGGVILEQIKVRAGQGAAFRDWYEAAYMPEAARRPGIKSAALLAYRPQGQMLPDDPVADHVAIYRLSDAGAMAGWDRNDALLDCPFIEAGSLAVSAWDPIAPRLTKDAVLHPTSTLLASEERARIAMGDKIFRDGGDKLQAR